MAQMRTDSQLYRIRIESVPRPLLPAANRARYVELWSPLLAPPVWIGPTRELTPLNGRRVEPIRGLRIDVGPNQEIFAVTVGLGSIVHLTVRDAIEQGDFTDVGGDVQKDSSERGRVAEKPHSRRPPGSKRTSRG